MDTLTLMMYGKETVVPKVQIKDIKNGKALTTANRWFPIICDQCKIDYEQPTDEYIVCNICNRVTYLEDLKP